MDPSNGGTGPAAWAGLSALGVALIGGFVQVTVTVLGWRHKSTTPPVEHEDDPVVLALIDQCQRTAVELKQKDERIRQVEIERDQWRVRYENLLKRGRP